MASVVVSVADPFVFVRAARIVVSVIKRYVGLSQMLVAARQCGEKARNDSKSHDGFCS